LLETWPLGAGNALAGKPEPKGQNTGYIGEKMLKLYPIQLSKNLVKGPKCYLNA
jgi:hypothetical protein